MTTRRLAALLLGLLLAAPMVSAADWQDLITPGLEAWESLGDGIWRVTDEGTLVGYRRPTIDALFSESETITKQQFDDWFRVQSWLYTKQEYGEFDLHVEYWIRVPGNSGISIRDATRAKFAIVQPADYEKTPAHNGYEVQINGSSGSRSPSGSLYTFVTATNGLQRDGEWNSFDIESRNDGIRIWVNGEIAAEHGGDPERPKIGPIGLQLHDQFNFVMFRNIRIREVGPSP
ncbi:MAG: DUF1080 domain-containing protein [Acidobacteriia bacterium]|nr:DUF1080 domain-containing protein [Terriglobia bacterium]